METFKERIVTRARSIKTRLTLAEATDARVLKAATRLSSLDIATVQLVGNTAHVAVAAKDARVALEPFELLDPSTDPGLGELAGELLQRRPKMTPEEAESLVREPVYYGALKVGMGASGALGGWRRPAICHRHQCWPAVCRARAICHYGVELFRHGVSVRASPRT